MRHPRAYAMIVGARRRLAPTAPAPHARTNPPRTCKGEHRVAPTLHIPHS